MPVERGVDEKGNYYRYGKEGKKYHYVTGNAASRAEAKKRADKQGEAIHASQNAVSALDPLDNVENIKEEKPKKKPQVKKTKNPKKKAVKK
jgi:hypothetical protein